MASQQLKKSHPKKRAFLAAYIKSGGNVTEEAKAAKIRRRTHYRWLAESEDYAQRFEQAHGVEPITMPPYAVTELRFMPE